MEFPVLTDCTEEHGIFWITNGKSNILKRVIGFKSAWFDAKSKGERVFPDNESYDTCAVVVDKPLIESYYKDKIVTQWPLRCSVKSKRPDLDEKVLSEVKTERQFLRPSANIQDELEF